MRFIPALVYLVRLLNPFPVSTTQRKMTIAGSTLKNLLYKQLSTPVSGERTEFSTSHTRARELGDWETALT